MKLYENHFEEYINQVKNNNLHQEKEKIYDKLPENINKLCNLILYGSPGIGKYSQSLYIIQKYSPSKLKYEKKLYLDQGDKQEYYLKISDIHFEVDFSLLGCNAKTLWNSIYNHISENISSKSFTKDGCGIILCKNFHTIHTELLDIFYNYVNNSKNVKFILLTESISFIPENILNNMKLINYSVPTVSKIKKCFPNYKKGNKVTNLKYFKVENISEQNTYELLCNKIIHQIIDYKNINFLEFRDLLYNIFIYQFSISDCIDYINNYFIENGYLNDSNIQKYFDKQYNFYILFNNNYRPIYHLENLFLTLCSVIHGF